MAEVGGPVKNCVYFTDPNRILGVTDGFCLCLAHPAGLLLAGCPGVMAEMIAVWALGWVEPVRSG